MEKQKPMRCTIVSHTHWDREWYRTFQSFRSRLVDTVDRVLELVAEDSGFHFQLDGQCIAVEDYLEIRPERRDELEAACRAGRIAIGPWYVQPDSLLPSGEAHVRNLLEGQRVAEAFGGSCRNAYTPDSFGHPAQFPQLFEGFGLEPFIYWRGNGDEIDTLGSEWIWRGPDGSRVRALHLAKGYFSAFGFGSDVPSVVTRLKELARDLHETSNCDAVLLMNGVDHMIPDANTREVAQALAKETGWEVERGLLETHARALPDQGLPEHAGELLGGRVAHLLPGVWSTRTPMKLENRRCEAWLEGWAEPWTALAAIFGAPDERSSLRTAWRALLANQAHDSICGCSKDRVHEQMQSRYDAAHELAEETTDRALERVAGLGPLRQVPAAGEIEIAVFNPSSHARTDRVRLALDGFPAFTSNGVARLLALNVGAEGFELNGVPARRVAVEETARPRLRLDEPVFDLEFMAHDIPAFGWKRFVLIPSAPHDDETDEGRSIACGEVSVTADDNGCIDVRIGEASFRGLMAIEDLGDRGDTYDFDALETPGSASPSLQSISTLRRRHPGGMQELTIRRVFALPEALDPTREARSKTRVALPLTVTVRIQDGVPRVDLEIVCENTARDHRLRLLFPTHAPVETFEAATTFDRATRTTGPTDASHWIHPAPLTFPHQGWISVSGLTVAAPGLCEAEVTPDGTIALTLVRSVGSLSRADLRSRPGGAGPTLATPGAQCLGTIRAQLSLHAARADELGPRARDAELGLRAVAAGPDPLVPPDQSLLRLEGEGLLLSALKPASDGAGLVVRVLNPDPVERRGHLALGFDVARVFAARLDETRADLPLDFEGREIGFRVPPHALRTIRLIPTGCCTLPSETDPPKDDA